MRTLRKNKKIVRTCARDRNPFDIVDWHRPRDDRFDAQFAVLELGDENAAERGAVVAALREKICVGARHSRDALKIVAGSFGLRPLDIERPPIQAGLIPGKPHDADARPVEFFRALRVVDDEETVVFDPSHAARIGRNGRLRGQAGRATYQQDHPKRTSQRHFVRIPLRLFVRECLRGGLPAQKKRPPLPESTGERLV